MIEREITSCLAALFGQYPFVTVTGPRQSGKTTLCRAAFPNLQYANLEAPDQRSFAESDPKGFLAQYSDGAILDEIQRVPELLSYLQVLADEEGRNSLFVLTGSEQFRLTDAINQSLAGRTALLRLLPFSLAERRRTGAPNSVDDILFSGFYPRIFNQGLDPRQALGDYFETYIERDVRRIGEIRNLSGFLRFVQICAGRVGQLANLSSLGADAGVSHTTARTWLTVLEASYIVFQLQPFHANVRKRLVKSPKLYFYDVGLASYLLGIENVRQVATHPLRGPLFENAVVVEALKHRFNRGRRSNLSFFRDGQGLECDLLYEIGQDIMAIESKSGATIAADYFHSLNRVADLLPAITAKAVIYGGTARQQRSDCEVAPLADLSGALERFEVVQDVAVFLEEKMAPVPDEWDTKTLDTVYRTHIRPTLDGLEHTCRPLADQLFHSVRPSFNAKYGQTQVNWGSVLDARTWEKTKNDFKQYRGFKLRDSRPVKLSHTCLFKGYTGKGSLEFDVVITVEWELDGKGLSRHVAVNGSSIPVIEDYIPYSDLETRSADVDRVVAFATVSVMQQIDAHAHGSEVGNC